MATRRFDPNEIYAQRLDLDKRDVFLRGDGNNPMFFNISGLPDYLSFGKHYFYISKLDSHRLKYQLKNNSEIVFEAKASNDVLLQTGVARVNQKNGVATCFVNIVQDPPRTFQEIKDGEGTLILAGILENKHNTQNLIPSRYQNKINYTCTFPINIRKNVLNAGSPKPISAEHTLKTLPGQFSFVKAAFSSGRDSTGDTFNDNGLPYNLTPPGGGTS